MKRAILAAVRRKWGKHPRFAEFCRAEMARLDYDVAKLKAQDPLIEQINSMSQMDMAHLWRFAPSGHPFFDSNLPYFELFSARFKELGGFNPAISKAIGWGEGREA